MSSRKDRSRYPMQPFRRAVFRGLGVVLPPILTIVILLWLANSVQKFVLNPVEWGSRQAIVWFMNDTMQTPPEGAEFGSAVDRPAVSEDDEELDETTGRILDLVERRLASILPPTASQTKERRFQYEDKIYIQLANNDWIPEPIRDRVEEHVRETGTELANRTGVGYYNYYVEHLILTKAVVIPVFMAGFILLMYLLGKFLAAGVGRILWNSLEAVITQLPIIRTVYSSVKQVTDFFVGESDIEFKRVVAVEYPRRGMWSIGFVTGESMASIRDAVHGEPVVSILMPTSPVPGTGFTVTARKSETIDLDIPVEQALQFVVSCGVVVPDEETQGRISQRIAERDQEDARQALTDH